MKTLGNIWFKRQTPNQNYIVRTVQHEDIASLLRLEREVYKGVLQWSKLTFERELNNQRPHRYYLIEHRQEVIAFIGARFLKKEAHITNLVVAPHYQRRGIATFLMNKIERIAKRMRCHTISLEVRMTNLEAKRFYRKRGYKTIKIIEGYYFDNHEDGVYMEKKINDRIINRRR